ncbi:MAG: DUF211 domain-containing protein [Candidatus Hodarchaeaceae archaeon]|nr:DUF211 domain-containing protein [Candidatus Hodarchaeaceae archaeon]
MPKARSPKLGRLVLDVLKPHSPTLPEFATKLSSMPSVEGVNVTLVEIDKDTETLKVTIEGKLDYGEIRSAIEEWGGVVHSVDEVVTGTLVGGATKRRPRSRTSESG